LHPIESHLISSVPPDLAFCFFFSFIILSLCVLDLSGARLTLNSIMNAEPNNDSPLNTQAAALWANQEGKHSSTTTTAPLCSPVVINFFFLVLNSRSSVCRIQEDGGEALQGRLEEEEGEGSI
jgi:hypothetical protein